MTHVVRTPNTNIGYDELFSEVELMLPPIEEQKFDNACEQKDIGIVDHLTKLLKKVGTFDGLRTALNMDGFMMNEALPSASSD